MRIVIFGDGPWAAATAARLADDEHEIVGVVPRTTPTSPALQQWALEWGAPVLRFASCNEPASVAMVRALGAELGVSVAYDQILRAPARAATTHGVVNLHAGMLPRYRGRNVINWAIINGETEIGVTAHWVDDGIDSGDIIAQRALPIALDDDYGAVLARVVATIPGMAAEVVSAIARGTAPRVPQDESRATYFGGRREGDEWIDWSLTGREIHDLIRGISRPGPGARTTLDGREVTIWRAAWDPAWPRYTAIPGQVVGRRPDGASVVKTGDGTLLVREVQLEGAGERAGAPRWRIGTRLGPSLAAELRALRRRVAELEGAVDREAYHASR
ncbi:MAG TPA: methionyl-tRNA formyltransferase [Gemmatimonadaceae bacterium]